MNAGSPKIESGPPGRGSSWSRHPSEKDLLALMDGETGWIRTWVVKRHLAACEGCCERSSRIRSLMGVVDVLLTGRSIPAAVRLAGRAQLLEGLRILVGPGRSHWTSSQVEVITRAVEAQFGSDLAGRVSVAAKTAKEFSELVSPAQPVLTAFLGRRTATDFIWAVEKRLELIA